MPGDAPSFSVVVAAYDRGAHIKPTIESALGQSFDDFELIVVGDGCRDDTLDVVRAYGSPKIATYALAKNTGSQSAPNNLGIARARGRYIAYLGHDDVWHPDHLSDLGRAFARDELPDVVTAGCVFHGPSGSGITFVTGLLDQDHPAAEHFLPPSALAHTRELIDRIGQWPEPGAVSAPVDTELMLRAVRSGAVFASTGAITVHKFAAGHRYLSYLRPASSEQAKMLSVLRTRAHTTDWAYLAEAAKAQGRFMTMKHVDYDAEPAGEFFQRNRSNKGLRRPPLRPLDGNTVLRQTGEPRGLDWHELETASEPYRWSGPSRKPRILIPFAGGRAAVLTLHVLSPTPANVLDAISFDLDGRAVAHATERSPSGDVEIRLGIPLREDDYSVLGIVTPRMFRPVDRMLGDDSRLVGIALGDIELAPIAAGGPDKGDEA